MLVLAIYLAFTYFYLLAILISHFYFITILKLHIKTVAILLLCRIEIKTCKISMNIALFQNEAIGQKETASSSIPQYLILTLARTNVSKIIRVPSMRCISHHFYHRFLGTLNTLGSWKYLLSYWKYWDILWLLGTELCQKCTFC